MVHELKGTEYTEELARAIAIAEKVAAAAGFTKDGRTRCGYSQPIATWSERCAKNANVSEPIVLGVYEDRIGHYHPFVAGFKLGFGSILQRRTSYGYRNIWLKLNSPKAAPEVLGPRLQAEALERHRVDTEKAAAYDRQAAKKLRVQSAFKAIGREESYHSGPLNIEGTPYMFRVNDDCEVTEVTIQMPDGISIEKFLSDPTGVLKDRL